MLVVATATVPQKSPTPSISDDEFHDAHDHFSDDETDDEQSPDDDISELVIKFNPLTVWNNSEDNEVEYILPPNFGKWNYRVNGYIKSSRGFIDHLGLDLINKFKLYFYLLVCGSADWIGVYPENFTGFDEYYGYEYTETAGEKPVPVERTIKINFSASIDLPLQGKFVFLYFQSTGMRGYSSMLGVSDPFPVIKRCPSPRPDTID